MASNSRQPATRKYVDQSVEAQRHYAEKLFRDAEARVEYCFATWAANQERRLESRLQAALEKIRPAPTVYPPAESPHAEMVSHCGSNEMAPVKAPHGWTSLTISRQDGRLKLSLR